MGGVGIPALEGDLLAVGALWANGAGVGTGKAYVYRAASGGFALEAEFELANGTTGDNFGVCVALQGSTLFVSAPARDESFANEGAVYVYELDAASGAWSLVQELHPSTPEPNGLFGAALDVEGELAAIGMPTATAGLPPTQSGKVWIYQRVGGLWVLAQTLAAGGAPGVTNIQFGAALDLDGDRLAVGVPAAELAKGAVHVFERSAGSFGNPIVVALPAGRAFEYFGLSLALDGDRMLVSRMRSDLLARTELFARTANGWSFQAELATEGGGSASATALALSDDFAAIGYPSDSPMDPTHPGHLELYSIPVFATASCFCGVAAPCGNADSRAGCTNSSGAGAVLFTTGSASVSSDDLGFHAAGLPAMQTALLFAGASSMPALPLGDGLRCVAGPVTRLVTSSAGTGGEIEFGPGLAALGGFTAGDERVFQVWYRDPSGSPCNGGANLTHASRVAFAP